MARPKRSFLIHNINDVLLSISHLIVIWVIFTSIKRLFHVYRYFDGSDKNISVIGISHMMIVGLFFCEW